MRKRHRVCGMINIIKAGKCRSEGGVGRCGGKV